MSSDVQQRLTKSVVTLENVSKRYHEGDRERQVLHHLNATFNRQEITALIGRSGSGKSTLLNLISGIDLPSQGEVTIDGINITQLSEHNRTLFRRKHIGFVFQFFNLIPTLTVEENLLLPLELAGGLTSERHDSAMMLLEQVGLLDRASSFPDCLSGGEQQRVAIARALVHRPTLLLADEPTGNLDVETGQQVLALLRDLAKHFQMTVIIVTHSTEITSIVDRILSVQDGQLIEKTTQAQK